MTAEKRPYGKLRDIIERLGGAMVYQREGYQYGAWELALNGKTAVIESTGQHSFPKLDTLYVPKVASPKSWDDYSDDLLDDAEPQLLSLLD
jgi:hypothetical protein